MLKPTILFLILCFCFSALAQQRRTEGFVQPYLTINTCTDKDCFDETIILGVKSIFNKEVIEKQSINNATVYIGVSFVVDKDGSIFTESVNITENRYNLKEPILKWLNSLSSINPVKNETGTPILEYYELFISLTIKDGVISLNRFKDAVEFSEKRSDEGEFLNVIYPGCEAYIDSNQNLKTCLSNNITVLVTKKLNFKKAVRGISGLGSFRTFVTFKIDVNGKFTNAKCFSQTKAMKKEALKSLKGIKKMTAGTFKGKDISVFFSVPITLRIEE